jgi:hypothetical protein
VLSNIHQSAEVFEHRSYDRTSRKALEASQPKSIVEKALRDVFGQHPQALSLPKLTKSSTAQQEMLPNRLSFVCLRSFVVAYTTICSPALPSTYVQ